MEGLFLFFSFRNEFFLLSATKLFVFFSAKNGFRGFSKVDCARHE